MAAYLLQGIPIRELDNNGAPLSGAKLYTWAAGTTSDLATYTDSTGVTPLSNPVVADAEGFYPQIWVSRAAYKLESRKADGTSVLWTKDNVTAPFATGVSGVGDFQSVVTACASAASTGIPLYWDGASYAAAGNIASFWDVKHIGTGSITRGGYTFYIDPELSQTNNVFVSTAGDDNNDGLTPTLPFATIQRAFDVVAEYAPCLPGRWVINIAAGTYTETLVFDSATRSEYPIEVKGPTIGHPSVPTAIIAPTATSDTILTLSEGRGWFLLKDLKLSGATTGTALNMNAGVRATATNVHIAGCLIGVINQHGAMFAPLGGIWTGTGKAVAGGIGLFSVYNATHAFAGTGAANGVQITAFAQGMLISEGAQGHLDGAQISTCGTGIAFRRGTGACNTDDIAIDDCDIGIEAFTGWFNNGITFGGTTANTLDVKMRGSAPEFDFCTQDYSVLTERLIDSEYSTSHTGTTAETQKYEFANIRAWMIGEAGHTARFRMVFSNTALGGTCTIRVYLWDGSTEDRIGSIVLPIGTSDAVVSGLVHFSNGNAQRAILTAIHNAGALSGAYETGAIDTRHTASWLRVKLQLSNAADTATITWLELYGTFAG